MYLVCSMDVKALFPAIMKGKTGLAIYDAIVKSGVVFQEINTTLLIKYLSLACNDDDIRVKIEHLIPKSR